MRISDYQWDVLGALPTQVRRVLRAAFGAHSHRHRGAGYARRADAAQREARAAVKAYGADVDIYSNSIKRNLAERGISGAYPDPVASWEALSEGARECFIHAMDKRDAREHAVSLALRLLDSTEPGYVRRLL